MRRGSHWPTLRLFPLARHDRVEVDAGQSVVFEFAREFFRELRWIKKGFNRYCHNYSSSVFGGIEIVGRSRSGIYSVFFLIECLKYGSMCSFFQAFINF
jgi:hypothetical protein